MPATDVSPQHLLKESGGSAPSPVVPAWSSPFAAANLRLAEQQHQTDTEDDDDDDAPLVEDVGRIEVRLSRICRAHICAY